MLSITRVTSNQASTYYSKDDYYLESSGEWYGFGAEKLNLTGKIQESDFIKLTNGEAPNGEFKIQSRGKNINHSAGVDLTFSAPKSVSVAGLLLDDKQIIEAHNKAVESALKYVEKNLTKVRLKFEGKLLSDLTDNLIIAKFRHVASRELDPQLHTHCLVFNASEKSNGEWRAVDYEYFFRNKMFIGQLYRNELAKNLRELGYQIKSDNKGLFELTGFDKTLLDEFSTRSKQIEVRFNELKERFPHVGDAELKAMATLDSRKSKDEPSLEELKEIWSKRLQNLGVTRELIDRAKIKQNKSPKFKTAQLAIDDAIKILTSTEAVVSKENILKSAMIVNMEDYSFKELEDALIKHPALRSYDNNRFFTTKELAATEIGIVNEVREQQNSKASLMTIEQVEDGILRYEMANSFKLTLDQKKAVNHILLSQDRIIAIQGDAGTGKTTMLDCVNHIIGIKKLGLDLHGLSYTGSAAHEIEQASGIESETLTRFLNNGVPGNKSTMFIVDEASMLSIKDMDNLLKKINSNDRIVLIGDVKQLQAIGAGKIFSTLQDENAISTIRMAESKRQTEQTYKEAVNNLAEKFTEKAFIQLDESNRIIAISNREERLRNIVEKYCERAKSTLLVTATNSDRKALNELIRKKLIEQGKVKDSGSGFIIRESKSLLEEQKLFYQNYKIGDLVVFNTDILGRAGTEAKIDSINPEKNMITVLDKNKVIHTIDLLQNGSDLSVYEEKISAFAKGDKVVFLKNDKGLKVNNGQTAEVVNIDSNGKMKLKMQDNSSKTINIITQYSYIAHGYAVTDYKSQGQTARNVIYHADTTKNLNFNQAYVGITRGKESVLIYTDHKETLRLKIAEEQQKTSIHQFEQKEKFKSISNLNLT